MGEKIIMWDDLTFGEDLEKGFFVRKDDDNETCVYGITLKDAFEKFAVKNETYDWVEKDEEAKE